VLDRMLVLKVYCCHVKLVATDHFVTEDALVHHFDTNGLHLNFASMLYSEERYENWFN